jgi:hypothetical protein
MARSRVNTGAMGATRGLLTVAIEAPELDEMIERLQKYAAIGDTDAKRVRKGMNDTTALVFGQAQSTVPVRTGAMKASLFKKTKTWSEGNVTGNVGSGWGMPKALIPFTLEGGRRPNKKGNAAITPRRWLYHAYSRVKGQVDDIWKRVLDQIAKDLAGKG